MNRIEISKWARIILMPFELNCEKFAPQHGGILPSEMLAFGAACMMVPALPAIIESGRLQGYSTDHLVEFGRALQCPVYSIEQKPDRESDKRFVDGVMLIKGNGSRLVPELVARHPGAAVLLDGPKNDDGVRLWEKLKDRIAFAGVHDLCRGGSNAGLMTENIEGAWFTDDPEYVEEFGHLDEAALKQARHTHESLLPSSSVLGLLPGTV